MKNLRAFLRCFLLCAAAPAAMSLTSCYSYVPGGYYGAAGARGDDGKGVQSTVVEETPPPVNYAPARTVVVNTGYYEPYYPLYYPSLYSYGYWPRYYGGYYGNYYRGGHYHGGGHHHGGGHYGGYRGGGGGGHYGGYRGGGGGGYRGGGGGGGYRGGGGGGGRGGYARR